MRLCTFQISLGMFGATAEVYGIVGPGEKLSIEFYVPVLFVVPTEGGDFSMAWRYLQIHF